MKKFLLTAIVFLALSSSGFCQTLDLTINSDKPAYTYGEAIAITANIKNNGPANAKIYSPAYWGVSDIVVKNSKGMMMNPAGLKVRRVFFEQMMVIAPGESQSYVFDDLMWFHCGGAWQFRDEDRLPPDTYTIFVTVTNPPQGECSAAKNVESTDFSGTLTSNAIAIEVLPVEVVPDVAMPVPVERVKPIKPPQPALPDVTPEGRKIERVFAVGGKLFSETDLFSDRYNGFYKVYHPNGQLSTEVRYKDGWQIYDKAFDEQGRPLFRSGIVKEYYGGGTTLASEGPYRNDTKHGEFKYYGYDGVTIVDIWHYMKGRKVGRHVRYDASGRFISEDDWGYPTAYVEKLKYAIAGLTGFVLILLVLRMKTKIKIKELS